MVPTDLRYTKDHEWVRTDGDEATIGITKYAADQLGDIVFVELPASGTSIEQFATFGVVESVKAVSDLFAPGGYEGGLDLLRHRRYEPHVVQLHDPREARPDMSS